MKNNNRSEISQRSEILLDTGRTTGCQRCTGTRVLEWTAGGVLTIFENRSGARLDPFKEGPEPEWSRRQFFNKRLFCLLLIIIIIADCFFTKHVMT